MKRRLSEGERGLGGGGGSGGGGAGHGEASERSSGCVLAGCRLAKGEHLLVCSLRVWLRGTKCEGAVAGGGGGGGGGHSCSCSRGRSSSKLKCAPCIRGLH